LTTECDVYSPCAVGGTLSEDSIPQLRCRIVAGSANNQLATPEDAQRLHDRGILYAPDYVINAGGVIQLLGLEDNGWDEQELERNLTAIGDTLRGLFRDAEAGGITPAIAAEGLAAQRIAAKRAETLA
jgi:leucine dehydrogenase